ncbi:MAG: phosphohistidine phosphatase SixA [Nitrospiraceae bacterium]|nr:MAG: phosphohistidine phosphatase SixA [Nitrospiraceae bacterium]
MYIYLVQHAEAVSKDIDPSRGLSEKGLEDINRIASYISGLDIDVEEILHSGKKRADQTAQVLATHLKIKDKVNVTDGLAPMDDPGIWFAKLPALKKNLMLVGHLPHMAHLASSILCGTTERKILEFETGCIVCLHRDNDQNWSTDWIIKPKMIT